MAYKLKRHLKNLKLTIMKPIKLSVFMLGVLLSTAGFAQDKKTETTKEQRMEMRSEKVAEKLELTDVQQAKMAEMRKESQMQREKIKSDVTSDETSKKAAMREMRQNNKEKMTEILTPEQSQKLAAMKADRKQNHSKKHAKIDHKRKRMMEKQKTMK